MLLYEREQFLIVLLYLHVTFSITNSSDLFYSIQFLVINVFGTVEESIDSFPVFNLGFCVVTFDFWSVESHEEEGDFCIFVRECLVLLMSF